MSLISELLSLKTEAEEHHHSKHKHHKKGDVVKHSQTNAVGMVMGGLYNGFYPVAVLGGGMQHWQPEHCDPHTPSPEDANHANNPPAPPPPEGQGGPGGPGPAGGAPTGGDSSGGGGVSEAQLDEMDQLNLLHGDVDAEAFYLAYHQKPGKKDFKLFVAKPFKDEASAHKDLERLKKKFANDDDKMDTLYAVTVQRGSTLIRAGVSECQGESVDEAFNDHRAFKRKELEYELRHEVEPRRASSRPMPNYSGATAGKKFGIEIDGKLWKKEGKAVSFTSQGTAQKSADTIAGRGKTTKVVPITEATLTEDPAIQALGKGLKKPTGTVPPKSAVAGDEEENADDVTAVNTPPAAKQANDATVDAEVDNAQTTPAYKVGDKVKTLVGPHKGEVHSVIHVFPDGRLNLTPDNLQDSQIKYRQGAVTAKPDQVQMNEGVTPKDVKRPLRYEDPKGFGRRLFNKALGIPSGPYKYKVGDTVSYVMQPDQKDGSGTGKITKLLDGHHYLINGKPVNQNEIKKRIAEDLMMAVEAITSVDPDDQYVIVMDRPGTRPQYYVGPSKRKSPDGMYSHAWSAGLDKAMTFDTMKDVAVAMQNLDREDPAVRVDGVHGRGAKYKMEAKLLSNLKLDGDE